MHSEGLDKDLSVKHPLELNGKFKEVEVTGDFLDSIIRVIYRREIAHR